MSTTADLNQLLSGYLAAAISSIAAANGLQQANKSKQSLQKDLADALPRPERVRQNLERLDPAARALFELLRQAGGEASWDSLLLWCHLGLLPVTAPKTMARAYGEAIAPLGDPKSSSAELQHVLARLECTGLALGRGNRSESYSRKAVEFGRARNWVIPREIAARLPSPVSRVRPPATAPATVLPADPAGRQRQLFLLWSWIWRTEPQLLKATGGLAKRELKQLAAALPQLVRADRTEAEQPWLDWARQLLLQLGLLADGDRCRGAAAAAERFWSLSMEQRLRLCLDTCLDLQAPVELRAADLSPVRGAAATWKGARQRIWAELAEPLTKEDADGWLTVDDLEATLALRDRDLLVPPAPAMTGYLSSWQSHRYASGLTFSQAPSGADSDVGGWRRVELPFIRRVLIQLWRLGLLDLGLQTAAAPEREAPPEAAVTHLRLAPWGRYLQLGAPAPATPEAEARVVLQPNFQILVMGPLAESRLFILERFADRTAADRAITYTLSRDSVYRGQRSGIGIDAMVQSLRQLTGAELPQNVLHSMQDWQRQHERVVLHRRVLLLQAADPAQALSAARDLGAEAIEPLGEGFLLVHDRPALLQHARRLGLILEDDSQPLPKGLSPVLLRSDGTVDLRGGCVDPRVMGWLQALADGDAATGWRLTEAAVRRCRSRLGLDAADQIQGWQTLAGTVPDPMVRLIKRGTGQSSPALLRRGCYLELPDAEALKSLGELPELAGAFGEPGIRGPLVWVDDERLAEIEAALQSLGLEVQAAVPPTSLGVAAAPAPAATAPKRRGRPPKAR